MSRQRWDDDYPFDDLDDAADLWLRLNDPHQKPPPSTTSTPPVDNAVKQTEQDQTNDIHANAWMDKAACKGSTHKMFPREHKDITYIPEARQICAGCPVKPECLDYALTFPPGDMHGVWAGLTPRQLAAEQKRRKVRPTVPTLAQMWQDLL